MTPSNYNYSDNHINMLKGGLFGHQKLHVKGSQLWLLLFVKKWCVTTCNIIGLEKNVVNTKNIIYLKRYAVYVSTTAIAWQVY